MTPEHLRRYYILRIISNPETYGIYDKYVTYENIQKALEKKRNEYLDSSLFEKLSNNSKKTISRDIKLIEEYFGVEINYKRNYGYRIIESSITVNLKNIYNKTELFILNQKATEWGNDITTQNNSLNGLIDLSNLIYAIQNKLLVKINYEGWYEDELFNKTEEYIQPLHIKEVHKDWYLIAHNNKIGIKSFCLDSRIKELIVTSKKVENPIDFSHEEYFKNTIGIINDDSSPERITIEVANHHFKYIVNRPIHSTQKIIAYPKLENTDTTDYENPDIWGTIEITVKPNYEFVMEIMKFNMWVRIIKPQSVRNFIARHFKYCAEYYK